MDIHNLEWECPHCGFTHIEDFTQTAQPWCDSCGTTFFWDEILGDERYGEILEAAREEAVREGN